MLALARLRLFPGRSPSADGVWRAKKGEVLSKIFALPWPPPCCLPPVTSACCQCLRWSAWGPCAAFSPSALSRGARAWRRCGSLSSIPGTPSVLRVLLRLLMRCCLHPTARCTPLCCGTHGCKTSTPVPSANALLSHSAQSVSHPCASVRRAGAWPLLMASLTNRGTRQSERATRVMACTTRRPKYIQGGRRAASQRRCLPPPSGGHSPSQAVC